MIEKLNQRGVQLKWVGTKPSLNKKCAMLIPQFNEATHSDFEARLEYFEKKAIQYEHEVEVILIDDGSTDNSLNRIRSFLNTKSRSLFVASVYPNANKVGALYKTTMDISHEFVLLSDFDTDIMGIDKIMGAIDDIRKKPEIMGCYFQMIPFKGFGTLFSWQQMEYAVARSLYKFHPKERTVPVMPGAGSIYKKEILESIYTEHSGLLSGEDREATVIGMKLGYKTQYLNTVLALTRPPLNFLNLLKQRVRWNLGYLETMINESKYYTSQGVTLTRMGIRTIMDIIWILSIVVCPVLLLIVNPESLIFWLIFVYTSGIFWCMNLLLFSPEELIQFKGNKFISILVYPLIKLCIDYFAWTGALVKYATKKMKL